ncbi:MAG: class I SAM-dependent methyltransferase [Bacteroidia bacterium]
MKQDNWRLLTPRLLENDKALRLIEYWRNIFNAQLGWHYVLDLIWQLEKIEELQLGRGAKILDAGAGQGLMQFLLAANGYDLISIDYAPRAISRLQTLLFRIEKKEHFTSTEEYVQHLKAGQKSIQPSMAFKYRQLLYRALTTSMVKETTRKRVKGNITFLQADLRDLSILEDNSVDAIISTSAIEHIPQIEATAQAIKELKRVLKPGQPMFITTNAAKELWYHEPSKAWCFDGPALNRIFGKNMEPDPDGYDAAFQSVKASEYLQKNLAPLYFKSGNLGMPWGKWDPVYTPVGIEFWKTTDKS